MILLLINLIGTSTFVFLFTSFEINEYIRHVLSELTFIFIPKCNQSFGMTSFQYRLVLRNIFQGLEMEEIRVLAEDIWDLISHVRVLLGGTHR